MHRLKSTSSIRRFRFAAFLLCVKYVLLPVSLGILGWSVITSDHSLAMLGSQMVLVTVLIAILQWLIAAHTGCPLCMTAVLARKHCVTHRHARTILGSHRLRVALTILFRNSFCCPYCHEPTEMKVRSNPSHAHHHD